MFKIKKNPHCENVNETEAYKRILRICIFPVLFLSGDRQKGWQFGENLRTQSSGWFPLAYTEIIIDDTLG